jgi:hypothetical protein
MSSVPRIIRAVPQGPVTRAPSPISVVATLRWSTGEATAVPAEAVAWTRQAVEVCWTPPGGPTRSDWIPASDVRRVGGPTFAPAQSDPAPRNPNRHRQRW